MPGLNNHDLRGEDLLILSLMGLHGHKHGLFENVLIKSGRDGLTAS